MPKAFKYIYWVILVFILAFALRFLWLGAVHQMYFTEVNSLYQAFKYQKGLLSLDKNNLMAPGQPILSLVFMSYGITMFGFNYFGWRFFSALLGAVSIIAFYYMVKNLFNNRAALIAAFLLSIDFLHLVMSRIAMADIYVFFFIISGFCFVAVNLKKDKSEGLLLAGTMFGLAMAINWGAALGLAGGFLAYIILSKEENKYLKGLVWLAVYPLILFVIASTVINISAGLPPLSWLNYKPDGLIYNSTTAIQEKYIAPAWTWPFLLRPTMLYREQTGKDISAAIIAFGNPLVYFLIIPILLYLIYKYIKDKEEPVLFMLIGFTCLYAPWLIYDYLRTRYFISVPGLYLYSFLPAIPFVIAGMSYLLDKMMDHKAGKYVAMIYLLLVFGVFLYFSPVLFGIPY